MTTARGRDPIHVVTWLKYDIWLQPTTHPTRPELLSYYNADLNLWLVEHGHEQDMITFYAANIACASAHDTGSCEALGKAFERLLSTLQVTITGPFPDPDRAQLAAEWLADLEGL